MRKDNTQNYQTSNTRVQHFSDFTDNIGAEKDELEKVGRSFNKNEDDVHNLPNLTKMKFNKTTRKMDNLSKDEINDRIAALTDGDKKTDHKFKIVDDEVNPNHKFQNVTDVQEHMDEREERRRLSDSPHLQREKSKREEEREERRRKIDPDGMYHRDDPMFDEPEEKGWQDGMGKPSWMGEHIITFEAYTGGFGYNNNEMTQKNDMTDPNLGEEDEDMEDMSGEDYSDQMPEDSYEDDYDGYYEDESESHEKSYMFFNNLETISRQAQEMMEMDRHLIDEMLNNGHDWAEDHMSSAKENVEQVYDFLKNQIK